MDTRKKSYKLRKIGKFNYSLTIPPTMLEQMGGYEANKDLYLYLDGKDLVISHDSILNKAARTFNEWKFNFNDLVPYLENNGRKFGYSKDKNQFFAQEGPVDPIRYGTKRYCVELLEDVGLDIPGPLLNELDEFIEDKILEESH